MVKKILAPIFAFTFLLFLSQIAHACFCSSTSTKNVFLSADIVFVGKVTKIEKTKEASVGLLVKKSNTPELLETPRWDKSVDEVQSVTLEIVEQFKGVTEKTVTLTTAVYGGGSCGVSFKVGENYLVLAGKRQAMLSQGVAEEPRENRTLEMRLKAEADEFNKELPPFQTGICTKTGNLRFMKDEIEDIRNFLEKGEWKKLDKSPFMN